MTTLRIDATTGDVTMAMAYVETELMNRVVEVESLPPYEGRDAYLKGLRDTLSVARMLTEATIERPPALAYSLTAAGNDALDRELVRRDQIAHGKA